VTASENVTGISVTDWDLIAGDNAFLHVRIYAQNSIDVDLSGVDGVLGQVPASLSPGEWFAFELQRWTVPAIPIDVLAQVASVQSTPGTSRLVAMPSLVLSGQPILVAITTNSDTTLTSSGGEFARLTRVTGSPGTLEIWGKISNGAEAGANKLFTTSAPGGATQASAHAAMSLVGATGALSENTDWNAASFGPGVSDAPNAPNATAHGSWSSVAKLAIAVVGHRGDNAALTSYPAGYYAGVNAVTSTGGGGGAGIALAVRKVSSASENPPAAGITVTQRWLGTTLLMRSGSGA
jgi:hypothetical protein